MVKAEYPILFAYRIVRMKCKCLGLLLVVKNDSDSAFLTGKQVPELLRYGEEALA